MIFCANPLEQYKSHKKEIDEAIHKVLSSNRYILGPEVENLEAEFASFIGVSNVIGVANGTDAIEIALRSLGIGIGDEVITVSHTAVATVAAIESTGASVVLVDIESDFYTLNPNQLDDVLTEKTKAVIAVHLYGQSADLSSINAFCKKNKLFLIEDVSQAHGAKLGEKRLGSIGDIACFSCYPTKNLGAIGDGGLIATNQPELARKIKAVREYGWEKRYISDIPGRNSRLDEIQAAILRVKLRYLDRDNQKRREIANLYLSELMDSKIKKPSIRKNTEPVFHLFVVEVDNRTKIIDFLNQQEIFPAIHYPQPIHLQGAYKNRIKTHINMSVTESVANKVLSLPIYPELSQRDAKKVVMNLIKAINP
jgi:dTDP-4-amino-4,6-dideoxygalactose transaminase